MTAIPALRIPDSTLAFRRDPYRFVSRGCDSRQSDVVRGRLMLRPAIFMRGPRAAELFYDRDRFRRAGAVPGRIRKVLFGEGGVQGLDGPAHAERKALFMDMMTPERLDALDAGFLGTLRACLPVWERAGRVRMWTAMQEAVAEAVMVWAGVPVPDEADVVRRRAQMSTLFEQVGALGPRYWQAHLARVRTDDWAARLIRDTRAGRLTPPADSALRRIAVWTDVNGLRLSPEVAAVELLNLLRPTTAVGIWIVFALHALETQGDVPRGPEARRRFVLEVRRHYPFFPGVMAMTRRAFTWQGLDFPAGTRTVLEVQGTNRHPSAWAAPDAFDPGRFEDRAPGAFDMIPQGGADFRSGHRCPGEWISERLTEVGLRFFLEEATYALPPQDLRLDWAALPAGPRDGLIVTGLRAAD